MKANLRELGRCFIPKPLLIWTAMALLAVPLTGCKNSERTWSDEAKSPDGKIVATAETLQPGGWGTGAPAETYVDLNWTSGSQKAMQVFAFNDGPDVPEGMNVGLKWVGPRQLELTYKGKPNIEFQAIRWQEVDIVAQSGSGQTSSVAGQR